MSHPGRRLFMRAHGFWAPQADLAGGPLLGTALLSNADLQPLKLPLDAATRLLALHPTLVAAAAHQVLP
jgi:hypothetical protein